MADLHGPECEWTVEQWDDLLAYLDVPIYKGNMPGFSHKTKADIAKARRNRLRSQGQPVSDTTDEEETLGGYDEDVTSMAVDSTTELRAQQMALQEELERTRREHEESLAEFRRRHDESLAEVNRRNEEWQQELLRKAAEERWNWEQEMQRRVDALAAGASTSAQPRWMEPGSGSHSANPPPQFPQQGFANPPPHFPQQGFPNPPGSSFFDGMDERRFRNDEENEYVDLLRQDDTGRNVANPYGTPTRGRGRGRRSSQ